MKKRLRHVLVIATLVVGGMVATQGTALAADPFLCPVVGDGVANADANNGDNGVALINGGAPLPGSDAFSFVPGNNQAGTNSNPLAHNTLGPGASPGPGDGNSDWSPIWPAS